MKKAYLISLASFILTSHALASPPSTPTQPTSPIVAAVLDSPVDLLHSDIAPHIDDALMTILQGVDEQTGELKSWTQLTVQSKEQFENAVKTRDYDEQINLLRTIGQLSRHAREINFFQGDKLPSLVDTLKTAKAYAKYKALSSYQSTLEKIGSYLHGTHVAGVMIDSRTNVRLIAFPQISKPKSAKNLSLDEMRNMNLEEERRKLRAHFAALTQAFQMANVRVVNMSLGFSSGIVLNGLKKQIGRLESFLYEETVQDIAFKVNIVYMEEFRRFFQDNPNVVFVVAAGNEKENLDNYKYHSSAIQEPNVINVAATDSLDRKFKIAGFSNTSKVEIEIAAPGAAVGGPLVSGGRIRFSGTSMAAPIVANRMIYIFQKNPQLTANQAIEELYLEHTISASQLKSLVSSGRFLVPLSVHTEVAEPHLIQAMLPFYSADMYSKCEVALTTTSQWVQVIENGKP